MAGNARTSSFMLSTATICLGPMSNLYSLNPVDHSIGLVKNVQVQANPTNVNLGQGLQNKTVMSVRTGYDMTVSAEVYEYTYRNLTYAAGLDGSGSTYAPNDVFYTSSAVAAAGATTVKVATDVTAAIPVGSWIFLQNGLDDAIHVAKVVSRSYLSPDTTITFTGYAVPANNSFPIGSRIGILQSVDIGAVATQTNLAAKIYGIMPKDNRPVVLMFPKVQITKGFNIAFQSDNFQNMPFEFTPYGLTASDTLYADFGDATMRLLSGT